MRHLRWIACALLVVAGCAAPITSGDVCDKEFVPAHTETSLEWNPLTESLETTTENVPDEWFVTIRRADEKDGGWITRRVEVSKDRYDSLQLGDYMKVE